MAEEFTGREPEDRVDGPDGPEMTPEVTPETDGGFQVPFRPFVFLFVVVALVIGGVVAAINILGDGDEDAAPDVEITPGETGALEDETEPPADDPVPQTSEGLASDEAGFAADRSAAESSFYGGDAWLVPWGEGFLEFSMTYRPPPLPEITDEIAAQLPAELLDAIEATGATTIDDVYRLIDEGGLWELFEGLEIHDIAEDPLAWLYEAEPPPPTMEVRRSADGTSWETLEDFSIPGGENISSVASDGTNLLVATQTWDYSQEFGPGTTSMFVATTTDLENWDLHELPTADPDAYPDHVIVETGLNSVAIGPDGWLVTTSTWAWLDEWTLLSGLIGGNDGWNAYADQSGLTVDVYVPFEGEFEGEIAIEVEPAAVSETGDTVDGPVEGEEGGDIVHEDFECCEIAETLFFGWDELGIEYSTWQQYREGEGGGTTSTWTAAWGDDPIETVVDGNYELGSVAGTDTGFVALAWARDHEGTMVLFSEDGRSWIERTSPAAGAGTWIELIVAVDGGVVATGSTEHSPGTLVWRADSGANDWELIEIPGMAADTWFGFYSSTSSRGVATLVDFADYSHFEPPAVEVDLTVERDGLMIVTDQRSDGGSSVLITDVATGEVLLDASSSVSYPQGLPEYLSLGEGETIAFVDPETGESVIEIPTDEILAAWEPAYQAALAETGWTEPTEQDWRPDFWLLASTDGSSWLLEDLPDGAEPWPQAAAINGDLVVARLGDNWSTFTLG